MRIVPLVAGAAVLIIVLGLMIPMVQDSVEDLDGDEVYLFCIMGQSNSVNGYNYGCSISETREDVPLTDADKAYYFGMSSPINGDPYPDRWEEMVPRSSIMPMIREGQWAIGGLEPSIAQTFVDSTGKTIVTVNCGRGGQSIAEFLEGKSVRHYADTLITATLEKLADEGKTVKMGCIFWLQGERNKNMEVDTYMETFREMWSQFKEVYGFNCIVISQTRAVNGGSATVAQSRLAEEGASEGIFMGTTASQGFTLENGLIWSGDGADIHYSQKGKDIIGKDLATYYVENIYSEPPKGEARQIAESIPIVLIIGAVVGVIMLMAGVIAGRD